MTRSAKIEIDIVVTYDEDAHPRDYLLQDPDYREQDQARLDAWYKEKVALCRHPS